MKIGPYKISTIETGDFRLDGGAMFGVVPKVLWNRQCPANESNRISMTARCLLLESPARKILIDTGIGQKEEEKFSAMFEVDFERNTLDRSLSRLGLRAEDITDVIYTHLHFDHAGGATKRQGSEVHPAFPNAQYFVQRRQYDHAFTRCDRDRASYLDHNYVPVKHEGRLNLLDGDVEIFPGVEILLSNGHTPALQTIKISDSHTTLWYPTDLIPLAAHIPLPYIMGYDLWPLTTLEDKKKYLTRAAEESWIVCFEHDPANIACTLHREDSGRIVKGDFVSLDDS